MYLHAQVGDWGVQRVGTRKSTAITSNMTESAEVLRLSWSDGFISISPANQNQYLCKQCRSRRDDNEQVATSRPINIYTVCYSVFFLFETDTPVCISGQVQTQEWKIPLQKFRYEKVYKAHLKLLHACIPKLYSWNLSLKSIKIIQLSL